MDAGIWSALVASVAVLGAWGIGRNLARRRRAETALRETERRHAEILDALPLGIYTYRLEADGRLVLSWANAGADRILGLDHRDLIGKPIEEAFPALASSDLSETYRQVARTGKSWFTDRFEYHDERCGGIFQVEAFRIRPDEVAVAFTDATHRWRMHDALQEYYFRNDAIVQSSPAGIAAIDRHRRIMLWNPACERIFGWSADEILGKPLDEIMPGFAREDSLRIQDLGFAGEGVRDVEVIRQRKDGAPLRLSLSTAPLYDAKGEIVGVMALILDLTERRAVEHALQTSEGRWRRLVETAQEGVWMTDAAGVITFVNEKLATLLGYRSEEATGRHFLEFVAPESRERAAEAFADLKLGLRRRLELVFLDKDGRPVPVMVSGCGNFDEEGMFLGALGMATDITRQRRLEEELRRLRGALAEAERQAAREGIESTTGRKGPAGVGERGP